MLSLPHTVASTSINIQFLHSLGQPELGRRRKSCCRLRWQPTEQLPGEVEDSESFLPSKSGRDGLENISMADLS